MKLRVVQKKGHPFAHYEVDRRPVGSARRRGDLSTPTPRAGRRREQRRTGRTRSPGPAREDGRRAATCPRHSPWTRPRLARQRLYRLLVEFASEAEEDGKVPRVPGSLVLVGTTGRTSPPRCLQPSPPTTAALPCRIATISNIVRSSFPKFRRRSALVAERSLSSRPAAAFA